MGSGYLKIAVLVLGLTLVDLEVSQAGYLPSFVCDLIRDNFLSRGCITNVVSLRCLAIYRFFTRRVLGLPACDFVTCTGYGNNLGECRGTSQCTVAIRNALCNNGDVCCVTGRTTTPAPTVRPTPQPTVRPTIRPTFRPTFRPITFRPITFRPITFRPITFRPPGGGSDSDSRDNSLAEDDETTL